MVGIKSQAFMLMAVLVYFILLVILLRKKTLNLKYGLIWIFSGIIMLILAIFPEILNRFSEFVGIASPTNALFAVIIFCLIMILMSLTAIVSGLNNKVKNCHSPLHCWRIIFGKLKNGKVKPKKLRKSQNRSIF